MSQSGQIEVQLYDYEKLNTNSLFRRLVTDIEGQALFNQALSGTEGNSAWTWIQT